MLTDHELIQVLSESKRIAVIGLSPVAARPSHGVSRYMISHGYEIYGVRPASPPEILGRPCYEKLSDLKVDVDLFDVFRNPDAVPGVVDEIARWLKDFPARKRCLWLQEGVGNAQAEDHARSLGLTVVSDLCILKEHSRLMPSARR